MRSRALHDPLDNDNDNVWMIDPLPGSFFACVVKKNVYFMDKMLQL
jgi:hypothetical protein